LQAFKPLFDMSQYVDDGDNDYPANMHEHSHVNFAHSSERGDCSGSSVARSNSPLGEHYDYPKEDAKTHESSSETDHKKVRPA
jgi:carnosine N-methyltransferase